MTDQQLDLNLNLCEIRYLWVPDITDYRLEFITPEFETTDLIWRIEITTINRLGWNSVHGAFRGR